MPMQVKYYLYNKEKKLTEDKEIKNKETENQLIELGWSDFFQHQIESLEEQQGAVARVCGVQKNFFTVSKGDEEILATVAGKLMYHSEELFPTVGDWVLLKETAITRVLDRRNLLSRGASGGHGKKEDAAVKEQLIAANLDYVFIVCGLDRDYNLRRIERYITLIYNCNLMPVIVMTKADLHENPYVFKDQVSEISFGIPIHLVSLKENESLNDLNQYLMSGHTVAMVGSSGAGKSTLINRLMGSEMQSVGEVSESVGKGKHTTTSRDLIKMPQGGMLIDNPGIREISFYNNEGGVSSAFPEIDCFAKDCKYTDCSHMHEPGCRVIKAVVDGELSQKRLESYYKMKREQEYLSSRQTMSADKVEKERFKEISLKIKAMKKGRKK